jgi:multisubunit Na+/H+ antiporter MnhB subunit
MPQGLQTLVARLVLLPGSVSAGIARSLSAERQQTELERIIEALIFSFFTYVVYLVFFGTSLPIEWLPLVEVHRWRVVFVVLIACALGVGWGLMRSKDLSVGFFKIRKLTQRTKDESVWNDIFARLGGTVQVGLHDGRNVIGWLNAYSDSGGERSVFLNGHRGSRRRMEAWSRYLVRGFC